MRKKRLSNNFPSRKRMLFYILILMGIGGCRYTVYPEISTPLPFEKHPVNTSEVKRIFLGVDYSSYTNGKYSTLDRAKRIIIEQYYKIIKEELENTGIFIIEERDLSFDLKIQVHVNAFRNYNTGLLMLAGMTALIIPTEEKGSLSLTFQISDKAGKEISRIQRSEEHSFIAQILLIFLMPFDWPFGKDDEQRLRLVRSALNELIILAKDNVIGINVRT